MKPKPGDNSALQQTADEFIEVVDTCFGLYLDCSDGFERNRDFLTKQQQSFLLRLSNSGENIRTLEDLDKREFFIGHGPPTDPKNVLYHKCTQGEYKERNATVGLTVGLNERFIGRYCIVLLYEYWEAEFRQRFADTMGILREKLTHDLFGDLRHLRHAIIHNRGHATKECESLRIVPSINQGTEIFVKTDDLFHLTRAIKAYVDGILRTQTGKDPAYRTIWHVQ